eukprot:TRINITY_DN60656_c0_g1_i1.p1 TRINITY_DN60656_c0_g1~~TRINITY_DN60656_c0_g1_i1.p1  ORF type:complete len:601 (+),score=87.03 TRINITY_DN60656_c0_g1_i1:575-2377(+)
MSVEHVGEYGVWIHDSSVRNLITRSMIRDTGAGGIRIGTGKPLQDSPDGSDGNSVTDCAVVYGSSVFHEGNGILVQKASFTHITHNEVAYFGHCGISVGWTWNYVPTEAHDNLILSNHVHHVGNGDLSDLAGIYTLGVSPGTQLIGNHVHDAYPYFKYGHGLYLDQASSHIQIQNNLVHHTEAANFLLHYGLNVTVENNIFAFATGGFGSIWQNADPGYPSSGPESRASHLTFTRNIVFVQPSVPPDEPLDTPSDTWFPLFESPFRGNSSFDFNLYFNGSGALSPSFPSWIPTAWTHDSTNRSLAEWQDQGQDLHSLVTDPKFANLTDFGFVLAPSSPAIGDLGFEPFDAQSSAGPRCEHDWRRKCVDFESGQTFESCAPPVVPPHGYIKQTSDFMCGTSVSYMCRIGFVLKGPSIRTCSSGGWTGAIPECNPIPAHSDQLLCNGRLSSFTSENRQYLVAADNSSFLVQLNATLTLFRGSGPGHEHGKVWSSNVTAQVPDGEYFTAMQPDGNLCTYSVVSSPGPVWCSGSGEGGTAEYFVWLRSDQVQVHRGVNPISDQGIVSVSYTHLRAHETPEHLVCRLLLEKKKKKKLNSECSLQL